MRFDRKKSHELLYIPLGNNPYISRIVYFPERRSFGVHVIGAVTRYGKSTVLKNLYVHIAAVRPVIILDYLGEHSLSKYPNFLSEDRNSRGIPDLVEIKDFKFKISDFDKAADWRSLGFAEKGSLLMVDLARRKEKHGNDPVRFTEILDDIPTQHQHVRHFEQKYGFTIPMYQSVIVDSCRTNLAYLVTSDFFAQPDDAALDFGKMLFIYKHININFGLDKAEIHKARAMAGKILEQLENVIGMFPIPPCIIIEEADVLAPRINEKDQIAIMSSLQMLIKFVLKLQKKHIELFFVVQDPYNLSPEIMGNYHTLILGQLPPNSMYFDLTRKLKWDIDNNYREFLFLRKGVSGYDIFSTYDSSSIY